MNPINNFGVSRGFLRALLNILNLRFYRLGCLGPYTFSKVMRPLVKYWRSKAISIVVYLDDGISAAQSFSNVKSTHCLLSRIFSNPGLFPTKISVSGSLFRSFADWVFFGISRTIVCSYHWERFQGSLTKWLKLCLAREFLRGNLLVLGGELFLLFWSRVMFISS